MTAPPANAPDLDLAFFYDMLGVEEHKPLASLVAHASQMSRSLAYQVMAIAEHSGIVGTGSAEELRRVRVRMDLYRKIQQRCEPLGAQAMKGLPLAAFYPDERLRPMNDVDLVVPDVTILWDVVGAIIDDFAPRTMDLTVFGGDTYHYLVTLRWPGLDSVLDLDTRAEITTCAFTGDSAAVPFRLRLPADPVCAGLLGVAEERFQRPFNARDAADAVMLLATGRPADTNAILAEAVRYNLAPELLELLCYVRERTGKADHLPSAFLAALDGAARRERARRTGWLRGNAPVWHPLAASRPRDKDVAELLRTEREPVFGMPVSPLGPGVRPGHGSRQAYFSDIDGGVVIRTPPADFLLVPGALVDPCLYQKAVTAVSPGLPAE